MSNKESGKRRIDSRNQESNGIAESKEARDSKVGRVRNVEVRNPGVTSNQIQQVKVHRIGIKGLNWK